MVERATYGSKQRAEELISRYNWLWEQIVGFVISYFHKFWWRVFEKQTKKRLGWKTQFMIEFYYRLPVVEKCLKKCLIIYLGQLLILFVSLW